MEEATVFVEPAADRHAPAAIVEKLYSVALIGLLSAFTSGDLRVAQDEVGSRPAFGVGTGFPSLTWPRSPPISQTWPSKGEPVDADEGHRRLNFRRGHALSERCVGGQELIDVRDVDGGPGRSVATLVRFSSPMTAPRSMSSGSPPHRSSPGFISAPRPTVLG
jgi:hypothetical protein